MAIKKTSIASFSKKDLLIVVVAAVVVFFRVWSVGSMYLFVRVFSCVKSYSSVFFLYYFFGVLCVLCVFVFQLCRTACLVFFVSLCLHVSVRSVRCALWPPSRSWGPA